MNLFDKVNPIFNIDEEINELLVNIDLKLNDIKITDKQKRKYMVTKSKIRSIHSSLAIEANSLSLFDVENILEHKQIIGKKDEVQEVKNAIEAYYKINDYDYKSEKDFVRYLKKLSYFENDEREKLKYIVRNSLKGINSTHMAKCMEKVYANARKAFNVHITFEKGL